MLAQRLTRAAQTFVVLSVVAAAACGGDSSPVSPTAPSSLTDVGATTPPATGPSGAGTIDLPAMLTATIQDEYHAQVVYQGVLADFGSVRPFVNIVAAEGRHAQAISQLFVARGLDVPLSTWTVANVPRFATLRDACAAAAIAEIENVALYDRFLVLDLPADVRTVFTNNREASVIAHLPAFNACK